MHEQVAGCVTGQQHNTRRTSEKYYFDIFSHLNRNRAVFVPDAVVKNTSICGCGYAVVRTITNMCVYVYIYIITSHSLLWRFVVLLTVRVYSSNHIVLYTIGISIMRKFQKSVGPFAVCPSVRPFTTLTKKPTPPLLTVE